MSFFCVKIVLVMFGYVIKLILRILVCSVVWFSSSFLSKSSKIDVVLRIMLCCKKRLVMVFMLYGGGVI